MSMRLLRLAPADAADPAKLAAFEATINGMEEEAVAADLLVNVVVQQGNDGSMFASIQYAKIDGMTRSVRACVLSEVEKRLARTRQGRNS